MKKGKNLRNVAMLHKKMQRKKSVLNSEQWKKGTTLIVGDSMLVGSREAKLSRGKRIKFRYFPGGKTEDLQYYLIPYLKKEPDNIIIHFGTNDSPYKTEDFIYKELVNVKEAITKFHPNCKNIVIPSPIVQTDRKEANNILKKYNNILKQEERKACHFSEKHFSVAFAQGWPALKLKWYSYTSWKSFIKDTYVLT